MTGKRVLLRLQIQGRSSQFLESLGLTELGVETWISDGRNGKFTQCTSLHNSPGVNTAVGSYFTEADVIASGLVLRIANPQRTLTSRNNFPNRLNQQAVPQDI